MATKNLAIGIDTGGTKIAITVGDARGNILESRILPTLTGKRTKECIADLLEQLKEISLIPQFKGKLRGVGVGIPGPVDSKKGIVPFSPNLEGWTGIPLKRLIERKLRLPVFMHNDANAAALGEKVFGQGRGLDSFIYMTVSTGVGGGVVVNGKLLEGTSFVAGEVGHMKVVAGGELCKCGMKGCLEAYASGTAIARRAKKQLTSSQIKKVLSIAKMDTLSTKSLGRAAHRGYVPAIRVYQDAGFYLGVGISNLLNSINPQKVILGGGVFKSSPREFWDAMISSCKASAWPEAFKAVKIVPSKLHGRVGDLGALALVFELNRHK